MLATDNARSEEQKYVAMHCIDAIKGYGYSRHLQDIGKLVVEILAANGDMDLLHDLVLHTLPMLPHCVAEEGGVENLHPDNWTVKKNLEAPGSGNETPTNCPTPVAGGNLNSGRLKTFCLEETPARTHG